MPKLLVIPHPAHLNALAATRIQAMTRVRSTVRSAMAMTPEGMAEGTALPPDEPAEPMSLRDILVERRETLSAFAAMASAATAKGIVAMRGIANSAGEARISMRPSYQLLPSLGAVIMDEEAVDRKALEQTASVFENVLIPLV